MEASSRLEETLLPGKPFANRFIVEHVLGRGGMGIVFAARHVELDELVAVKVMLPDIAANAETAARFYREARASVRIKSDYVVRVLDVAHLDDGTPYMVMEYLEGIDLDTLLEQKGTIALETAARYIIEAADAIAAAHAIGIVHRDLKPQNLFLAKQGDESYRIKVLDFGISKLSEPLSHLDASLTQTSSVMGSPLYMSPEQMQSAKTVDQRSDIWALGCVLFELVTGKPPFNAATVPELCAAVFTEPTPLPTRLRPDLPKALNAIIGRCLEKSPDQRYSTVAQFATDLLAFAPEASPVVASINRRRSSMPPPGSTPAVSLSMPQKVPAITAINWGHVTGPPQHRRPHFGLLSLGIACCLAAVGSFSWWSLRHGTGRTSPTVVSASIDHTIPASDQSNAVLSPAGVPREKSDLTHTAQPSSVDAGIAQPTAAPTASNDRAHAKSATTLHTGLAPRAATIAPSAAKNQSEMPSAAASSGASLPRAPSLKIDIK